jgi:hypothetical protein
VTPPWHRVLLFPFWCLDANGEKNYLSMLSVHHFIGFGL